MNKMRLSQQGAVLAMSLLMLLMISILGVAMIRQNRSQMSMAGTTQQQTTTFTQAENVLRSAEKYIASQRYVSGSEPPNPLPANCNGSACPTFDCQYPSGVFQQLKPGDLSGGSVIGGLPAGASVEITKTVCISGYNTTGPQQNDCSDPNSIYSYSWNPTTKKWVDSGYCDYVIGLNPDNKDPVNPTGDTDPVSEAGLWSANPCTTELYTLSATVVDTDNNQRTVESTYAVRCDN